MQIGIGTYQLSSYQDAYMLLVFFFFLKLNTSICVPPKKQQQKPAVHHVECSKIQGFCSTRTNTEILHVPSPVAGHTRYSTRKSHGKSALRGAKARPDFILLNSL